MRTPRLIIAALSVLGVALVAGTLAGDPTQAALFHPEVSSFGPATVFNPYAAINQANGNLYLSEANIRITGSEGGPPAGSAPEYITPEETPAQGELYDAAVDNSCYFQNLTGAACGTFDPSNEDVYALSGEQTVDKFKLNAGKYEYICQFTGWGGFSGSACLKNEPSVEANPEVRVSPNDVTVDTQGNVYIAAREKPATVYEFNSAGEQLAKVATNLPYEASRVVVDGSGDVYISMFNRFDQSYYQIVEMKQTGPGTYEQQPLTEANGRLLAIDVGNGMVYAADGPVSQYNANLEYESPIGGITEAAAIAVNDATHELLVIAQERGHYFGIGGVIPDLRLTLPGEEPTTLVLKATVNPDALPVTGCEFELTSVELIFAPGPQPAYKHLEPCSPVPGSGTSPQSVSGTFSGLVPNAEYRERLIVSNANGINQTPQTLVVTPVALPRIAAAGASGIGATTAVLTGVVNPEHGPTTYRFEFGTNADYGRDTAELPVGSDRLDDPVIQKIAGLQPDTTYHYALIATSKAGSVTSADGQFTTASLAGPSVSAVGVRNLAPGAATVSGTVAANGLPTTYEIDFGTDTGYATRSSGQVAGNSQTVSLSMLYLQPATTYHYRVVASNEAGTVASPDQTFTTPGYTLSIPPVLPFLATPSIAFPAGSQVNTAHSIGKKALKRRATHKRRKTRRPRRRAAHRPRK